MYTEGNGGDLTQGSTRLDSFSGGGLVVLRERLIYVIEFRIKKTKVTKMQCSLRTPERLH